MSTLASCLGFIRRFPPKPVLSSANLRLSALAVHLVKKHRRRRADVQRIHVVRHRNRHRLVARGQNLPGNPVAFAAENHAAIAGEIRLRQIFLSVCGCAARQRTPCARNSRKVCDEVRGFQHRQLEQRAHRVADGAAQEQAAARFAGDQRRHAERHAVAHERADIFRVGQTVHGDEKTRTRTVRQDFFQGDRRRDFADGQHALINFKAHQFRHHRSVADKNGDVLFRPGAQPRLVFRQALLDEQHGDDGEIAFQHPVAKPCRLPPRRCRAPRARRNA